MIIRHDLDRRRPSTVSRVYRARGFPKWIDGPDGPVMVQNAAEERRILRVQAQRKQHMRANAVIASRADKQALTLAPEITELRTRGHTFRQIASTFNERGIPSARGRK